jgi:hypothetical protein
LYFVGDENVNVLNQLRKTLFFQDLARGSAMFRHDCKITIMFNMLFRDTEL